ncbi:hypothetical protein AEQU3_03181 [Aequorivita antarctica]|nr:hypothetical protein AEQU3_03181 [Aequorivita antarctica]
MGIGRKDNKNYLILLRVIFYNYFVFNVFKRLTISDISSIYFQQELPNLP